MTKAERRRGEAGEEEKMRGGSRGGYAKRGSGEEEGMRRGGDDEGMGRRGEEEDGKNRS